MRALIRGDEELVETAWSGYVKTHLDLMHTQEPAGCGYALAEDYAEGYEWVITVRDGLLYASRGSPKQEDTGSVTVTEDEKTYTVDGKTYTISELKDLVNNQ